MKNASQTNKPGHVTKGDIFDDLGFSSTESLEAKIKADIWQALMKHIEQHGFSQTYLVTTLKVHQPDVSNLLKGKISKVSITNADSLCGQAQSRCAGQGDISKRGEEYPDVACFQSQE